MDDESRPFDRSRTISMTKRSYITVCVDSGVASSVRYKSDVRRGRVGGTSARRRVCQSAWRGRTQLGPVTQGHSLASRQVRSAFVTSPPLGVPGAKYSDEYMSVGLFVCSLSYLENHIAEFHQICLLLVAWFHHSVAALLCVIYFRFCG